MANCGDISQRLFAQSERIGCTGSVLYVGLQNEGESGNQKIALELNVYVVVDMTLISLHNFERYERL